MLIEAPQPVLLATLADDDESPAADATDAVRGVVPAEAGWSADIDRAVESVCEVLVDGFGWEVTLEPFSARVPYSLHDDPLVMGGRLRDVLDRGWERVSA